MKNNKKRIKTIVMALALVVAIAVTGAFAYLTDRDQAKNVFTMGNVEIDLQEQNWDPANGVNMYAGKTMPKDPTVLNTGDNESYVYLQVKIPTQNVELFDSTRGHVTGNGTELFTLNNLSTDWIQLGSDYVSGGNTYRLYAYKAGAQGSEGVLAAGARTPALFDSITFANVATGYDEVATQAYGHEYATGDSYLWATSFVDKYNTGSEVTVVDADGVLSVDVTAFAIQANGTAANNGRAGYANAWTMYCTQNNCNAVGLPNA